MYYIFVIGDIRPCIAGSMTEIVGNVFKQVDNCLKFAVKLLKLTKTLLENVTQMQQKYKFSCSLGITIKSSNYFNYACESRGDRVSYKSKTYLQNQNYIKLSSSLSKKVSKPMGYYYITGLIIRYVALHQLNATIFLFSILLRTHGRFWH